MFVFQVEVQAEKPIEVTPPQVTEGLKVEGDKLKLVDKDGNPIEIKIEGKPPLERNKAMGEYDKMKNLDYYNVDFEDVKTVSRLLFSGYDGVGEYFYEGVKSMLKIEKEVNYEQAYQQLVASGIDEKEAKKIIAAMNPAYWAIQYMVNLVLNYKDSDDLNKAFILGRITYYFANSKETGGLGKDVYGNPVGPGANLTPDKKVSISVGGKTSTGKVSKYFGYGELKKDVRDIYNKVSEIYSTAISKIEKQRTKILNTQREEILSLIPKDQERKALLEGQEGGPRIEITKVEEQSEQKLALTSVGFDEKYLGSHPYLKDILERASNLEECKEYVRKDGGEFIVDVVGLAEVKKGLENKPIKDYTPEDANLMYLIYTIELEINAALIYVLELHKEAADGTTQYVDLSNIPGGATNAAGVGVGTDNIPRDIAVKAFNNANHGKVTPEDGIGIGEALKAQGLTFETALDGLNEERTLLEGKLKMVEALRDRLTEQRIVTQLTQQASSDLEETKTSYNTTNPKEAVATMQRREVALYAAVLEKEQEFWKKYFNNLKSAYDYAKSKKPPAMQRFMRVLSTNVGELSKMANTLQLETRLVDYSLNVLSFANIRNAGKLYSRDDLPKLRYGPRQFSAYAKEEKGNLLVLNNSAMQTLVFFGILKFNALTGTFELTKKGIKYLSDWCKETGNALDEIKKELSGGILSSKGQNFLVYAGSRIAKENGLSEADTRKLEAVGKRATEARSLLSKRVEELDKRIVNLGAESLVVGTEYEKNYAETIVQLRALVKSS
ncbi:MAG: hypothetical protein ACP5KP_00510 [Candidatus Micrarchaeia archaeon]